MSRVDHLAKARDYLARGEEFYARAADEIIAANRDGLTQAAIGKALGRSQGWVGDLIRWRRDYRDTDNAPASPWGGEDANTARYDRQARTALKDPDRRRKALADLDTRDVEQVARDANDVVMGRIRAERREHQTTPTVGELMGDDPFDPSQVWADSLIISVTAAVSKLAARVKREGLILGSLEIEEALADLEAAEARIAEIRAALRERITEGALS